MPQVRTVLQALESEEDALWSAEGGPHVSVDQRGNLYLTPPDPTRDSRTPEGQLLIHDLDLLAPFEVEQGFRGPDLRRPRPHLEIIPGKLAGSPHLERTRLETQALAALSRRGVANDNIYRLYPRFEPEAIDEALDLEAQLDANLRGAARPQAV